MKEDEYAEVQVTQLDIDVVVRVVDPEGEQVMDLDASSEDTETVRWIAHQAGTWQVEVAPFSGRRPGLYEIALTEKQPAGTREQLIIEADRLLDFIAESPDEMPDSEVDSLFQRILDLREQAYGAAHPEYARTLRALAQHYNYRRRYDASEPLYLRALGIFENALGEEHLEIAETLESLGLQYNTEGRYEEALPLYTRALGIHERLLGADHPTVANSLNTLGLELLNNHARYNEAEPLLLRALAIWETVYGTDHFFVATALSNLASVYSNQGRFDEAEATFRRIISLHERTRGAEHYRVAEGLTSLANLYRMQGRFDEAIAMNTRAITIGFSGDFYRLTTYRNLGDLYVYQGQYDQAEAAYALALEVQQELFGTATYGTADLFLDVARLHHAQNDYITAGQFAGLAFEVIDSLSTGLYRSEDLAWLYRDLEHAEAVERLLQRTLDHQERRFGPEHPELAGTLTTLAALYYDQGSYAQADSALHRAIGIFDATPAGPDTRIATYVLRAQLHKRRGDLPAALADLDEALRGAEALRPRTGGGEETRAGLFQQYARHYNRMAAWLIESGDPERAFEYAERGRARALLDQIAASEVDVRASIPPEILAPLEQRETMARARLAEYQQRITLLQARTDLTDTQRIDRIAALNDSLRAADFDYRAVYAEIKNASPLWRDLGGDRPVDVATVQQNLVPDEGLMLLYQVGDEQSVLFVLPPEGGPVETRPLLIADSLAAVLDVPPGPLTGPALQAILGSPEEETSNGLALASRGVETPGALSSSERLHALWQILIPEALRDQLLASEDVVVIPDGALFQLPFEALVVNLDSTAHTPRYWLDEGPVVRYAPSATALHAMAQRSASSPRREAGRILSLSDAIYDPLEVAEAMKDNAGSVEIPENSPSYRQADSVLESTTDSTEIAENPPRTRASYVRAGGLLARLPGTALETEAIELAYGDEAARKVITLQGLDASERQLRAMVSEQPGILHLATHGLVDERRGSLFASLALTPPVDEAMSLDNDGFLQLHELYELHLPHTELAVLSACATNVGESVEGEGVFALSRGFLVAGARRVVASQWAVDDASTAVLMGAFFEAIARAEHAGQPVDYARALRDARRLVRADEPWSAPYYWAPFVMIGME